MIVGPVAYQTPQSPIPYQRTATAYAQIKPSPGWRLRNVPFVEEYQPGASRIQNYNSACFESRLVEKPYAGGPVCAVFWIKVNKVSLRGGICHKKILFFNKLSPRFINEVWHPDCYIFG